MTTIQPSEYAIKTAMKNGEAQLGDYDVTNATIAGKKRVTKKADGTINVITVETGFCTCEFHAKHGTCKHGYMVHLWSQWNLGE
jgi:hypothetical protein